MVRPGVAVVCSVCGALGGIAIDRAPAGVPMTFVEVGAAAGLGPYHPAPGMSAGAIAADYDNDGDTDIFIPTGWSYPDLLYVNNGDGTFTEAAAAAGLASTQNDRSALWFDFDGDDDLDLAVLSDSFQNENPPEQNAVRLLRNDAGVFTDITAAAGLPASLGAGYDIHAGGMSAGDLDGDGDLDLIAALWEGRPRVFLNNADGTFTEAGAATGIGTGITTNWQPLVHDFDGDGRMDVLFSYDFAPNNLWMNRGPADPADPAATPVFEDIAAAAGIDTAFNEMGIAPGDPDNDGDFDFYMTNIFGVDTQGSPEYNVLFRNDSTPNGTGGFDTVRFTEIARDAGVDAGGVGWGCVFADFDGDGLEDLAEVSIREPGGDVPTRLWRNTGGLSFVDVSAASGFATVEACSAIVAFDRDRDGDLDILVPSLEGTLHLLDNTTPGASAGTLVVRPRMPGMNRRAIGAVVRVTLPGGTTLTRLITAGTGFAGQQPAEAHFGLGSAASVDSIRITWPDGTTSESGPTPAGGVVTITSPCPCGSAAFDVNGDGRADIEDLHEIVRQPADVNGDGVADAADTACVERYLRRFEARETSAGLRP